MKVWVTKHALTSGIKEVYANIDDAMACWQENGWPQYAHGLGRNWHKTQKEAFERAEVMRLAKITSLKKSITKLERLKFI